LTRDTISLLQSASNGQQERQQMDGNYRKQREWVEAGILPTELLPLKSRRNLNKKSQLSTRPKPASVRMSGSSTDYCLSCLLMRCSTKTRQVSLKTDTKICVDFSPSP
jgi:hypothetical protein